LSVSLSLSLFLFLSVSFSLFPKTKTCGPLRPCLCLRLQSWQHAFLLLWNSKRLDRFREGVT
jgi:hypothetical protein